MLAKNTFRIYSYVDSSNYSFLEQTKERIKSDYNNISFSKIIKLAVVELRTNNSYEDIKQKLIQNELIQ